MNNIGTYNGGKSGSGTYQQIINHIPPHSIYVEPFLGHGGIFRHKRLAQINILNDINKDIIDKWKQYKFNHCNVTEDFLQGSLFEKATTVVAYKPEIILSHRNAFHLIPKISNNTDTFIFCDPPYVMQARKSQQKLYAYEWETDQDHINLSEVLHNVKCNVMISSNINNLYFSLYKDWNFHRYKNTGRAGQQDEIIFFNYDKPDILHDCRYLGNNYRQRDYLKRKVKRWRQKLSAMPQYERTALLSDIVNNYKEQTQKIFQL